jgi:hypothetical protein
MGRVTEEEKIERIARQLCIAAGKNPDARIRLGAPLSFAAGECTVIRPLIVPEWKQYCREARRLAMSDAEDVDPGTRQAWRDGKSLVQQALQSVCTASVAFARRPTRMPFAPRLRAFCCAVEIGAAARVNEVGGFL